MKVIASWLNGTIVVAERDTGFTVVVRHPGRLPTRIGPIHRSRLAAMRAASDLAGVPQDDPTVG